MEKLGIKLIKQDLPFRLNHVNCFVAKGEKGWKVIDTGLHNKQTVRRWEQELAGKTISDILITHYHPDHFGYAGGLQKKLGARVSMTKIDANAGLKSWQKDTVRSIHKSYLSAGIPEKDADAMVRNTEEFVSLVTPYPNVNHYFQEGEKVVIGNYAYKVIFTPGHSDGLISFYNKEKKVLLSTDHILPKITPNISYWFHGDPNPLATYLQSLDKISKLDAEFVIPSHGKPFYGANDRIKEIKSHHDDRLTETLAAINSGGTVYEVCEKLFRKTLTVHETRFAIGETLAHLEYLRKKGECIREMNDGHWWYSI